MMVLKMVHRKSSGNIYLKTIGLILFNGTENLKEHPAAGISALKKLRENILYFWIVMIY